VPTGVTMMPAFGTSFICFAASGEPMLRLSTSTLPGGPMKRILVLLYGVACYAVFFATFLYAIAFLGNFVIGNSIDADPTSGVGQAIAINIALLAMFALQHSIMARPAFKRWWTRFVPPTAERSTYVLFSSLALILLFWQWQPIGAVIWQVDSPAG